MIIGIDPGLENTGITVIDTKIKTYFIHTGTSRKGNPVPQKDRIVKLHEILTRLRLPKYPVYMERYIGPGNNTPIAIAIIMLALKDHDIDEINPQELMAIGGPEAKRKDKTETKAQSRLRRKTAIKSSLEAIYGEIKGPDHVVDSLGMAHLGLLKEDLRIDPMKVEPYITMV